MNAKENFQANLPYYMKQAGMNQIELAKAVGKSESSVSLWLSGKAFPRIDTIQKIADALGCETDNLLVPFVTCKITGYSDEKQTKEMTEYWWRLHSNNKKAVLNLMKALAEGQEDSDD